MEKKKKYGNTIKEQLRASVRDQLYNFILCHGTVRGAVVNGTRMVNEMRWNHGSGILETLVLGHAYLAAALMTTGLKGHDRLALQVECSGPIKGFTVEANAFGEVRGYLNQVPIEIQKELESFDLSSFFGAGFLSVTKYLEDAKQPFTGKVMMEFGNIAQDLALYHLKSEQVPSAFALSVDFDEQGEVRGAGGVFLQALPGADEQTLEKLEKRLDTLPTIAKEVHKADFPDQWLRDSFAEFNPRLLDHKGVEFMCHCSRKQIQTMLALLKPEDLKDMAENGPFPVQIRCHHCNTLYDFKQKEIKSVLKQRLSRKKG